MTQETQPSVCALRLSRAAARRRAAQREADDARHHLAERLFSTASQLETLRLYEGSAAVEELRADLPPLDGPSDGGQSAGSLSLLSSPQAQRALGALKLQKEALGRYLDAAAALDAARDEEERLRLRLKNAPMPKPASSGPFWDEVPLRLRRRTR